MSVIHRQVQHFISNMQELIGQKGNISGVGEELGSSLTPREGILEQHGGQNHYCEKTVKKPFPYIACYL